MVICLERGADLHMTQLMPLPLTVSCFSKIQIGFTFLVPAHPGSPRQRAVERVCVCVRACVRVCVYIAYLSTIHFYTVFFSTSGNQRTWCCVYDELHIFCSPKLCHLSCTLITGTPPKLPLLGQFFGACKNPVQ